ncbi:MAG: DUF2252 family protein [Myxococcota bacterium]
MRGPVFSFPLALLAACSHGGTQVGGGPASQPSSKPASAPASRPSADLRVEVDSFPFQDHPKLLERLRAHPHGYFRFINRAFSQNVCDRWSDVMASMATVNLHGDAHLEQYSVTDISRGLSDFDDSSTGPPVLDLLRMMVSIQLTSEFMGWPDSSDLITDRFFEGYVAALQDPGLGAPLPAPAARLRARFSDDRREFLEWVKTVMEPVDEPTRAMFQEALQPYVDRMIAAKNGVDEPAFFDIRQAGLLRLGIGSALDEKYLLRVEGPTASESDDVILEVKQVRDLGGVSCIDGNEKVDPFRILLGQSRIAYSPYQYLGYLRLKERTFWIHSWVDHYQELDPRQMLHGPEELGEVLYDIGVQLGRGHPNQIAAPFDEELRALLVQWVETYRERLDDDAIELRDAIDEAYAVFVRESEALAERLELPQPAR